MKISIRISEDPLTFVQLSMDCRVNRDLFQPIAQKVVIKSIIKAVELINGLNYDFMPSADGIIFENTDGNISVVTGLSKDDSLKLLQRYFDSDFRAVFMIIISEPTE